MKNPNTSYRASLKEKWQTFYQCEIRTFKRILGIK